MTNVSSGRTVLNEHRTASLRRLDGAALTALPFLVAMRIGTDAPPVMSASRYSFESVLLSVSVKVAVNPA